LVGLVTTLFHTLTYQRKTVIMLHLATHTNDVPVFSSPAFSSPAFSVPPNEVSVTTLLQLLNLCQRLS